MWLIYAAINVIGSVINNFFIKLATGKISSLLGALFVYLGGLFAILLLFPFLGEKIVIEKQGAVLAFLGGAALSIGTVAWFRVYKLGAPMSTATIIAVVSIMVLSTTLGVVFFQERITIRFVLGVVFAITALYLLVTGS